MAEMSEYELQRLEHIRRNQECDTAPSHGSPHPSLERVHTTPHVTAHNTPDTTAHIIAHSG